MCMVLVCNKHSCDWLDYRVGLRLGFVQQIGGSMWLGIGTLCMWHESLIRFHKDWWIGGGLWSVLS